LDPIAQVSVLLGNDPVSNSCSIRVSGALNIFPQVATLSNFIYLPRLLPAPQTFIRTSRPERLETAAGARVIGIESGNSGENIHHVAHALHRGDKLAANTVTCVRVSENEKIDRPSVKAFGPLAWLSIIGCLMSTALFILSIVYDDGMALLATIFLSLLSTNTGIANKWKPSPNDPKPDPHSPPGDVVIKYPQGAFIVVKCDERTARYLYFNPSERCIYNVASNTTYRGLSLISTLLLMGGVICLANSRIELQTGFAAAYMMINIFYWIGAALPPAEHWNLKRLHVEEIEIEGGRRLPGSAPSDGTPSYTEALWKAIAITRTKNWIKEAGWAPKTPAWDEWLFEAESAARQESIIRTVKQVNGQRREVWKIRSWDYKGALSVLLRPNSEEARRV
jgi:hypothetical protein